MGATDVPTIFKLFNPLPLVHIWSLMYELNQTTLVVLSAYWGLPLADADERGRHMRVTRKASPRL